MSTPGCSHEQPAPALHYVLAMQAGRGRVVPLALCHDHMAGTLLQDAMGRVIDDQKAVRFKLLLFSFHTGYTKEG